MEFNSWGVAAPCQCGHPDVPRFVLGECLRLYGFAHVSHGKWQEWDSHTEVGCLASRKDLALAIPYSRHSSSSSVYSTPHCELYSYMKMFHLAQGLPAGNAAFSLPEKEPPLNADNYFRLQKPFPITQIRGAAALLWEVCKPLGGFPTCSHPPFFWSEMPFHHFTTKECCKKGKIQVKLPLIFNSYTRTYCTWQSIKEDPKSAGYAGSARPPLSKRHSLGNYTNGLPLPS